MSLILPLVSRLSIKLKNTQVVPFTPNWCQRIFLHDVEKDVAAGVPIRKINLKARQLGISTATEAFIYIMSFVVPNSDSLVIADEQGNSDHLLGMTTLYWETDPLRGLYSTKYQARNTLHWRETGSSIKTQTARNTKAGRSRTIQMLHASEVGFWDDAQTTMTGLMQAVPEGVPLTAVFLESTANGRGNYFHTMWRDAVAGNNDYTPLFFPWWGHGEYRASYIGLPHRDLEPLDEEEKKLLRLFKHGLHTGRGGEYAITIPESEWYDALAWRRWYIWNKCQGDIFKFHQEYPSTPEEAFIATGVNVFPQLHLDQCYQPEPGDRGRLIREGRRVVFQRDPLGPVTIYRAPHHDLDWGMYSVGGDATATLRGDYACAQVINRRTFEQVAVYRQRIDPIHFGEELWKLGTFYNTALMAPENEGPGYATIGALMSIDYLNMFQMLLEDNLPGRFTGKFGWSSSYKTKSDAVSWLLRLLVDHTLIIHDAKTYDEMDNYVTLEGGGYGPSDGADHDDTVMALAISITASVLQGPLPAYGDALAGVTRPNEPEPSWMTWGSGEDHAEYEGVY